MKKIASTRYTENGLTLIELSIALIVIGLLTTAFLQLYSIQQEKRLKELQQYKIFTIADGFAQYLSEHQHYPCPARRDRSVKDADFGDTTSPATDTDGDGDIDGDDDLLCNDTIVAPGACNFITATPPFLGSFAGYCVAINAGRRIRIGSVPYKAIGVGKEDVVDIYGNQFTYAVVEDQASEGLYVLYDAALDVPSGTIPDKRAIILRDFEEDEASRDPITGIAVNGADAVLPVELIFFSHGEEGAGSYTASGVANATTCPASSQIDSENCDGDATFVTDLYSVRSAGANGVADDTLVHNLLEWTYIWDTAESNSKSIYNRDSGNMGVGIEDGNEKLHIIGNLRVDAGADTANMGKLQTDDICDVNDNDCFISEVLGGDIASTERLRCPTGLFMSGVKNGRAICVSYLGGEVGCPPGVSYIGGFNVDEAASSVGSSCRGL